MKFKNVRLASAPHHLRHLLPAVLVGIARNWEFVKERFERKEESGYHRQLLSSVRSNIRENPKCSHGHLTSGKKC